MTYDFESLYQEYLKDCEVWGYPSTMQGFFDQTYSLIDDRIDDGLDPEPHHLFIIDHVKAALESDPGFIKNYPS